MKVGFIGLGAMGQHMARNLHAAGILHAVWNRTRSKALAFAESTGSSVALTPAALAQECEILMSCVSADADLLEVVNEIVPGVSARNLVLDCSTISAATAHEVGARLAAAGAGFLDCPVSGGTEGARDGTLTVMVGGEADLFERAHPVLQAIGTSVTLFGPLGSGQAAKATNQIMVAGVIQGVAEAMAFAKAEQLPLDKLLDALSRGAGTSWYFEHRGPNMVHDSYPPGFRVALHRKDLEICKDMAARQGMRLPIVEMTLLHYRRLIESGFGEEDISALHRLKTSLFESAEAPADPDVK